MPFWASLNVDESGQPSLHFAARLLFSAHNARSNSEGVGRWMLEHQGQALGDDDVEARFPGIFNRLSRPSDSVSTVPDDSPHNRHFSDAL